MRSVSGRVGPIPIIDIMERGLERQITMGDSFDIIESIMSLSLFTDDVVCGVGNSLRMMIMDGDGTPIDDINSVEDILHRLGVDEEEE
jgi:hypothetical protein